MEAVQLESQKRKETGKGHARKLRANGKIPAILYGPETEPVKILIDFPQLESALKGKSVENIIFELNIGGNKPKSVMVKELQRDPVTRDYLHIDFYEIAMGKEIEVDIPLVLINTPAGVTKGGILEHIRRELSVSCMPKYIVEKIEIDVSGLDIGDSIHISDVTFPPGLKSTEDENLTIATVVAPSVITEEEEKEEEEEEGEEIEGEEEL